MLPVLFTTLFEGLKNNFFFDKLVERELLNKSPLCLLVLVAGFSHCVTLLLPSILFGIRSVEDKKVLNNSFFPGIFSGKCD